MAEFGIDDVSQAIGVGVQLSARAAQFQADVSGLMAMINAYESSKDLFPEPGDEFSDDFAPDYRDKVKKLKEILDHTSGTKGQTIGDSLAGLGTYLTESFQDIYSADQQNSQSIAVLKQPD